MTQTPPSRVSHHCPCLSSLLLQLVSDQLPPAHDPQTKSRKGQHTLEGERRVRQHDLQADRVVMSTRNLL